MTAEEFILIQYRTALLVACWELSEKEEGDRMTTTKRLMREFLTYAEEGIDPDYVDGEPEYICGVPEFDELEPDQYATGNPGYSRNIRIPRNRRQ